MRGIAQKRHQVAGGRKANAKHFGVPSRIPEIIDQAGLECRPFGQELDAAGISIGPARRGYRSAGIGFTGSHRQTRLLLIQRGSLIAQGGRVPRGGHAGAKDKLVPDGLHQRLAVIGGNRAAQAHAMVRPWGVGIPTAPHQRIATVERKAVPGVRSRGGIIEVPGEVSGASCSTDRSILRPRLFTS